MTRLTDTQAVDAIAAAMSGVEWSPDTLDLIADVVRGSGREVANSDDVEPNTDERKFYKNTITLVVLSEEPINDWELGAIIQACDDGPCVAGEMDLDATEVSADLMATLLIEAGSDPGFFMLDDPGEEAQIDRSGTEPQ